MLTQLLKWDLTVVASLSRGGENWLKACSLMLQPRHRVPEPAATLRGYATNILQSPEHARPLPLHIPANAAFGRKR
jgi:hypothetical protein